MRINVKNTLKKLYEALSYEDYLNYLENIGKEPISKKEWEKLKKYNIERLKGE